jgi:hypothetical protein
VDQLFEIGRKTFDTPEFRGITFIESEAKSIINRVPGNFLPFDWTINPYRGCSHACTYCQSGNTPILMADGRTKRLADVRVGDEIYGTERQGVYRRFVITRVLDHAAGEGLAVVAVGGYGRGELAPHSDIDLLFLHPYKPAPRSEQVVEATDEQTLARMWDGPDNLPSMPELEEPRLWLARMA